MDPKGHLRLPECLRRIDWLWRNAPTVLPGTDRSAAIGSEQPGLRFILKTRGKLEVAQKIAARESPGHRVLQTEKIG